MGVTAGSTKQRRLQFQSLKIPQTSLLRKHKARSSISALNSPLHTSSTSTSKRNLRQKVKNEGDEDEGEEKARSVCEPSGFITLPSGAVFHLTNHFDTLFVWILERYQIWFKRQRGDPAPWSKNPKMVNSSFCNVFREADRMSQYIITRIINPLVEEIEARGDQESRRIENNRDFWFRIMLFRFFFRIETWEALQDGLEDHGGISYATFMDKKTHKLYIETLNEHKIHHAIFGDAYESNSPSKKYFKCAESHTRIFKLLEKMLIEDVPSRMLDPSVNSLRGIYETLRPDPKTTTYPSIGRWTALQFSLDLSYTPYLNVPSKSFAFPGPGARGGLRSIFNESAKDVETNALDLMIHLEANAEVYLERAKTLFPEWECERVSWDGRGVDIIAIEHSLCEVKKYLAIGDVKKEIRMNVEEGEEDEEGSDGLTPARKKKQAGKFRTARHFGANSKSLIVTAQTPRRFT